MQIEKSAAGDCKGVLTIPLFLLAAPFLAAPAVSAAASLLRSSFAAAIPSRADLALLSTAAAVPASVPLPARAHLLENSHLRLMDAAC